MEDAPVVDLIRHSLTIKKNDTYSPVGKSKKIITRSRTKIKTFILSPDTSRGGLLFEGQSRNKDRILDRLHEPHKYNQSKNQP